MKDQSRGERKRKEEVEVSAGEEEKGGDLKLGRSLGRGLSESSASLHFYYQPPSWRTKQAALGLMPYAAQQPTTIKASHYTVA
eukprot:scaffold189720_cov35-Tisochrysis_lutea.AAC.1